MQIRYRRRTLANGWDFRSTELSDGFTGPFAQPVVLAATQNDVTVAFSGFPDGVPRFLIRRRVISTSPLEKPVVKPTPAIPIAAGPNPLPRGGSLTLFTPETPNGPWVDVFDVAGRRLASVELRRDAGGWRGELQGRETLAWPAGVYFVRPRSTSGPGKSWVMLR